MTLPVFTAITDAVWEADLVSAFERHDFGVVVVRRCVDLADLLAAAAGGTAKAVLLSADLRRFDRDAVARLEAAGVAIVALVAPALATGPNGLDTGDDPGGDAERRLRLLGVTNVVPADAGPEAISSTVASAVSATMNRGRAPLRLGYTEPRGALSDLDAATAEAAASASVTALPAAPAQGRVIAIWGPTGAPGRTTVAVSLAAEIARLGVETLLIDADCYGGVVAQALGMLDEAPGLAAAVRQANAGTLDTTNLGRLAASVSRNLRVLTGISRTDRWPELKPSGLVTVLEMARDLVPVIVVDCGFGLEQDEELSYDTAAPRRNGSTLAILEDADVIVAVGSADPIGLQRLVRGLAELADIVAGHQLRVVVNRVRKGAVHGDPAEQIRAALARHAGIEHVLLIPYDRGGLDEAIASGRTLAEAAPDSPVCKALLPFAIELADLPQAGRRRRKSRRIA